MQKFVYASLTLSLLRDIHYGFHDNYHTIFLITFLFLYREMQVIYLLLRLTVLWCLQSDLGDNSKHLFFRVYNEFMYSCFWYEYGVSDNWFIHTLGLTNMYA